MISPWMSKVNGLQEEWAERHCRSAIGETSPFRSLTLVFGEQTAQAGRRPVCVNNHPAEPFLVR
jgi:hypothetical protein